MFKGHGRRQKLGHLEGGWIVALAVSAGLIHSRCATGHHAVPAVDVEGLYEYVRSAVNFTETGQLSIYQTAHGYSGWMSFESQATVLPVRGVRVSGTSLTFHVPMPTGRALFVRAAARGGSLVGEWTIGERSGRFVATLSQAAHEVRRL